MLVKLDSEFFVDFVTEEAKYAWQTTSSHCGLVMCQSLALVMQWL